MKIIRGLLGVVGMWGGLWVIFVHPNVAMATFSGVVMAFVTIWVFMMVGGYD